MSFNFLDMQCKYGTESFLNLFRELLIAYINDTFHMELAFFKAVGANLKMNILA